MASRNILFVHQNFPGQFPHIAQALRARGDRIAAIGSQTARNVPGIDVRKWDLARGTTPGIFPDAIRVEADLIRARAAAEAAMRLKADGFIPDLIIGHPGWGETLHLREIFPNAPQILLGEFYYQAHGGDSNFDPEFDRADIGEAFRVHSKNAALALGYLAADRIVVPTPFQASMFPALLMPRITIHHEGVDLSRATRRPAARLAVGNGRVLDATTPVITFVSRTLERLRGFHIFMRALPALQAAVPEAEVVIIGKEEGTGYGAAVPEGFATWKDWILSEMGDRIDLSRIHFLGQVPHARLIDAFSISRAHVYYSYPFVLSWSLVEAMACGCLVLGSDTMPVRDAITNGVDGILNNFFDVPGLADAMIEAVRSPERFVPVRERAAEAARERFDRERIGVPGWLRLIDTL